MPNPTQKKEDSKTQAGAVAGFSPQKPMTGPVFDAPKTQAGTAPMTSMYTTQPQTATAPVPMSATPPSQATDTKVPMTSMYTTEPQGVQGPVPATGAYPGVQPQEPQKESPSVQTQEQVSVPQPTPAQPQDPTTQQQTDVSPTTTTPEVKAEVGEVATPGGDFSLYVSGQMELDPTNPDYMKFGKRLSKFNAISGLTADQLGTYIANDKLRAGTQVMRDLQRYNPELYQQAQRVAQEKKSVNMINESLEKSYTTSEKTSEFSLAKGAEEELAEPAPTAPIQDYISEELQDKFGEYADLYNDVTTELMSSPSVQRYKDTLFAKQQELNEIDLQLKDLYEEAGRVLGDEAPDYLRSAYVATKGKAINKLREPLLMEIDLAQNQLQMEVEEQMTKLDAITTGIQTDLRNKQREAQQAYKQQQDALAYQQQQSKFAYQQEQDAFKNQLALAKYTDSITDSKGQTLTPTAIADFSTEKRGKTNLQCGELVNDYVMQATGSNPTGSSRMGDTLNSKMQAIESIGVSQTPVPGGLFVSNPLNNSVGHTGIVQSVNPDGSITVLEANAGGSAQGEPPTTKTYTSDQVAGMSFSQNPGGTSSTNIVENQDDLISNITSATFNGKVLSKSNLKKYGLTGSKPEDAGLKIGEAYIKSLPSGGDDYAPLLNGLLSVKQAMGTTKDSQGRFEAFTIPDAGMRVLANSDVHPNLALNVFGQYMKQRLDSVGKEDGTPIDVIIDDLKGYLSSYPEMVESPEEIKLTLRSIMSDEDFASAVDEESWFGLGGGIAYDELVDTAVDYIKPLVSKNL